MKKLLFIFLILSRAFAQTAPSTQIAIIDAQELIDLQTVHNKASIARQAVFATTPAYDKTFRYSKATYAYYFKTLKAGTYQSIPAAKGGISLDYKGAVKPTLGLPYITKEGLLFLQNQTNVRYIANIKGDGDHTDIKNAVYPREVWIAMYKPDYFVWEQFCNGDFYMGDLGAANNGVRFTNDPTIPIFNAKIPVNQYSVWRVRLTATPSSPTTNNVNVELWINGIKQPSNGQVQTWFRKYYCVALGTDTNNEHVGFAEIFHTPVLSDADADKITTEMLAEYGANTLPYASNVVVVNDGKNQTVTYKYNGNAPQGSVQVRWIDFNGKGPEGSTFRPEFDGKITIPTSAIKEGAVWVTVVDKDGLSFGIPSAKNFKN